jgi:hypothetical protein
MAAAQANDLVDRAMCEVVSQRQLKLAGSNFYDSTML